MTSMEYRYLGKSGLMVSCLSLGGWVTYGTYHLSFSPPNTLPSLLLESRCVALCCFRYLGAEQLTNTCITAVPLLVIGGQVSPEVAQMCMKTAFDNGVNFFDTAEVIHMLWFAVLHGLLQ